MQTYNSIPVKIGEKIFDSKAEAAKAFEVHPKTFDRWLGGKTEMDQEEFDAMRKHLSSFNVKRNKASHSTAVKAAMSSTDFKPPKFWRKVYIGDEEYPSLAAAARAYNLSRKKLGRWLDENNHVDKEVVLILTRLKVVRMFLEVKGKKYGSIEDVSKAFGVSKETVARRLESATLDSLTE